MEHNDTEIPNAMIKSDTEGRDQIQLTAEPFAFEEIKNLKPVMTYLDNLNFSQALEAMKQGYRIRRPLGFKSGKGYVFLKVEQKRFYLVLDEGGVVSWHMFSMDDILADDFEIVIN